MPKVTLGNINLLLLEVDSCAVGQYFSGIDIENGVAVAELSCIRLSL